MKVGLNSIDIKVHGMTNRLSPIEKIIYRKYTDFDSERVP